MLLSVICLIASLCVLVSAVPISTVIPQTYPIYQQENRYSPASPSCESNSCLLQNTAQIQSTNLPLDVTQILLNTILSKPSVQAILGSNSGGYGAHQYQYPNTESLVPKVVNNYIFVPYEHLNLNKTETNEVDTSYSKVNIKANKKTNQNGTKTKSKHNSKRNEGQDNNKSTYQSGKSGAEKQKLKQKHTQPLNKKGSTVNNVSEKDNNGGKNTRKIKQQQNEVDPIKESIADNINLTELGSTSKGKKRKKKENAESNAQSNVEKEEKENVIQVVNDSSKKIESIPGTNTMQVKVRSSVNKVPKSPKHDSTSDFYSMFPSIPDNMAVNFMTGMNQFNDPQLKSILGNYEQFFQSITEQHTAPQKIKKTNKRRRKSKKNRRKRKKDHKNRSQNKGDSLKKSVVSIPVTIKRIDTNNTATQSESKLLNMELPPINEIVKYFETVLSPKETDSITTVEEEEPLKKSDDTNAQIDEKSEKDDFDDTPLVYYGLIEDYYPLFTDDALYDGSNERFVKNLDNDKYMYNSNNDDDEKNYDTLKNDYVLSEHTTDDKEENKHTYHSVEEETIINLKDDEDDFEELSFRSPPSLEIPDFKTRNVQKMEMNTNQFDATDMDDRVYVPDDNDKSSNYSNAKSSKVGSQNLKQSKRQNDVETVYARSKVVKYGQIDISEEDHEKSLEEDWEEFQGDGITYIIAKSLDDAEFW